MTGPRCAGRSAAPAKRHKKRFCSFRASGSSAARNDADQRSRENGIHTRAASENSLDHGDRTICVRARKCLKSLLKKLSHFGRHKYSRYFRREIVCTKNTPTLCDGPHRPFAFFSSAFTSRQKSTSSADSPTSRQGTISVNTRFTGYSWPELPS